MHKNLAVRFRERLGRGRSRVVRVAFKNDVHSVTAVLGYGEVFHMGDGDGHVDGRANAEPLRGDRDTLSVIAGGGRDDALGTLLCSQRGHAVVSAPPLEGMNGRYVLSLDENLAVNAQGEAFERRWFAYFIDALARLEDFLKQFVDHDGSLTIQRLDTICYVLMRIAVRPRHYLVVVCAFVSAVLGPLALAQENAPLDPANLLTVREIEASIQSVQASTTLTDEQKAQIVGVYNDAIVFINARDEWSAKTAAFQQDRASAPDDLESYQRQLSAPPQEVDLAKDFAPSLEPQEAAAALEQASTADLEIRLADAERAFDQLRRKGRRARKSAGPTHRTAAAQSRTCRQRRANDSRTRKES